MGQGRRARMAEQQRIFFLLFELSLTNCKEHNKKGGLQKAKIEVGTLLKVTDLSI